MSDLEEELRKANETVAALRREQLRLNSELNVLTHYPYSQAVRAGWKSYPVRVVGSRASTCHLAPMLLVQSMEGGFVTANCSVCGYVDRKGNFTLSEFRALELWVSCPKCKKRMLAMQSKAFKNNYAYACETCNVYINLADLLPRWEDLLDSGSQ